MTPEVRQALEFLLVRYGEGKAPRADAFNITSLFDALAELMQLRLPGVSRQDAEEAIKRYHLGESTTVVVPVISVEIVLRADVRGEAIQRQIRQILSPEEVLDWAITDEDYRRVRSEYRPGDFETGTHVEKSEVQG